MTDSPTIIAITPLQKQCAHPGCLHRPKLVVVMEDGEQVLVTQLCHKHRDKLLALDDAEREEQAP